MRRADNLPDPEDYFAETRMSFGDHIEELRYYLIRAILGLIVGIAISFAFGKQVVNLITAPVESQLQEFYKRRVLRVAQELKNGDRHLEELNQPTEFPVEARRGDFKRFLAELGVQFARGQVADDTDEEWVKLPLATRPLEATMIMQAAERLVTRPASLSTMNVMEAFMVYFKVCALTGLVISSPFVFWQIWAFIAAGLYPDEKKYVHVYLPVSLGLFLTGVFFCEFLVIPKAISALLWFNEWLGLEPDLRLNEWLSFAILVPLVFGLSFQTPLVMLFLAKLGILDADSFRRKRRIAWFAMAVFAAAVTPIDALSMLLMWVPMCGLYEIGILMVQYLAKPEPEMEESEELVEV
jgi:sec-independent protein translocase protein TatC